MNPATRNTLTTRIPVPRSGESAFPRVIESPYLMPREVVAYLRLPSLKAFFGFADVCTRRVEQGQIPVKRIGARIRVDKRSLDATITVQPGRSHRRRDRGVR